MTTKPQQQAIADLRKANSGAAYRIRNALRVNPTTHWCEPSPITAQAKAIAEARKA